jgi:hypothetical protein
MGRSLEKPPLAADLRARIAAVLRPDVERLEDLIGRTLAEWLPS